MTIHTEQIIVEDIRVEVVRKPIRTLRLAIYPPDGRVRLSAPLRLSDAALRSAVTERLDWIRRKQGKMRDRPRAAPRDIVTGEIHYVRGLPYRLNVVETENGRQTVELNGARSINLFVRPGSDRERRLAILQRWYRERLLDEIPGLIEKWEPIVGVEIAEWRIKQMKTRWGTCNIHARRIWLNLELARKPCDCLTFVLVHEMVHLHERLHNDRFKAYMDRFMPQWRQFRDELSRTPELPSDWAENA